MRKLTLAWMVSIADLHKVLYKLFSPLFHCSYACDDCTQLFLVTVSSVNGSADDKSSARLQFSLYVVRIRHAYNITRIPPPR